MRRFAFVVVVLSLASSARADEATARQHFKRGIDLYDHARFVEALGEFEAAYREKASGTIKQNIALSLRRLNRPAEAAAAFDEAIEEGKDSFKPETRAAIERELAELERTIATVRVATVDGARAPVDAAITVTPVPPRSSARVRTFRLAPGLYTFNAHAAAFPDPPEKRLALVAGAPIDVTFVFGDSQGTLVVRASHPDAIIAVDGAEVGRGTWSGSVAAGKHAVSATLAGRKTTTADVSVGAGASVDYPIQLVDAAEAPPPYLAPPRSPPKRSRFALAGGVSLDSTSYRLGVPAGEPAPHGTRRDGFVGLSFGGRFGVFLARTISLDLHVEIGQGVKRYDGRETTALHIEAVPMLRFVAPGSVRFTAATGFGGHWLSLTSPVARASGLNGSWRLEGGVQIDVRPVFLEGALFFDVHGVGSVRAANEERLLYASPAVRGGIRLGVGATFE